MNVLNKKIDFAGIISARRCNPNGDPTNSNRPREDFDGYGIISDVCLKRKIRNQLKDEGHEILMEVNSEVTNDLYSVADRVKSVGELKILEKTKDKEGFVKLACQTWIDVRSFGQVFAYKGKSDGVSIGIRGPVSIQEASSIDVVDIMTYWITKSTNANTDSKDPVKRDASTMSVRHKIDRGVYVLYGSIYPQLAERTGFTKEDADTIKYAVANMFKNDVSQSRPTGSMVMEKVFWWEHDNKTGQYSPARVFKSLKVTSLETEPYFKYELNNLHGLKPEVIDGW